MVDKMGNGMLSPTSALSVERKQYEAKDIPVYKSYLTEKE
jgi:hypothetical protein